MLDYIDDFVATSGATCWSVGHRFEWRRVSEHFWSWICWRCGKDWRDCQLPTGNEGER